MSVYRAAELRRTKRRTKSSRPPTTSSRRWLPREDYSVSKEGQRNLSYAPAEFRVVYGRNEIALQNVHQNIAAIIGMPLE